MMEQVFIAFTGVIAVYLSQTTGPKVKYACLFGIAGQPFWFYSAYMSEQWGIFALCFFYTFAWCKGFKTHWIKSIKADKR